MNRGEGIILWGEDPSITQLEMLLGPMGYTLFRASSDYDLLKKVEAAKPYAAIIDAGPRQTVDMDLVNRLRAKQPQIRVFWLVRPEQLNGSVVPEGIETLTKPIDPLQLQKKVAPVESPSVPAEAFGSHEENRMENDYGHLLCMSQKMREVMMIIDQVAPTNIKVLIRGESGTGKELIARTIYARSLRKDKPFIKVLCAALPEGLLESELFGYEKGAFTGALRRKPGKFEFAHHGSIFLDEIGEINPSLQAKLLQVLQDGEFCRIGGETDVKVDTRVIAATNKNLEKAVEEGAFREDLFYRLNVVSIHLPPLRERREEIPFLCNYFLEKFNRQYNKSSPKVSENVMSLFMEYDWPGNIRELENAIKRIVVLEKEDDLFNRNPGEESPPLRPPTVSTDSSPNYSLKSVGKEAAGKAEKELIRNILYQTHWNRKKAAEILQISYKALLYKIKKYELNKVS